MDIEAVLKAGVTRLQAAGIGTARLDTLVLLEDVTGKDRAWLLAHTNHKISSTDQAVLIKLLKERANHIPLAYVRQKTEFYGREFVITPAVLEPRPESETMIDLLKKLSDLPTKPAITDLGTGSGALGITAKIELPNSRVELLEIDPEALKIAQKNVDKYTMYIEVILSDLLASASQVADILLCNLPYVPDTHQINQAARHEPDLAIFGGPDGLGVYRRLFKQVEELKKRPLFILTESLPTQHHVLESIAQEAGYHLTSTEDFIQVFRDTP